MKNVLKSVEKLLRTRRLDESAVALNAILLTGKILSVDGHVHGVVCQRLVPNRISLSGSDVLGISAKKDVCPFHSRLLTCADYDAFFGIERVNAYSWTDYLLNCLQTFHSCLKDLIFRSRVSGSDIYFIFLAFDEVLNLIREHLTASLDRC